MHVFMYVRMLVCMYERMIVCVFVSGGYGMPPMQPNISRTGYPRD